MMNLRLSILGIVMLSHLGMYAQLDTSRLVKNIHAAEDSMVTISKRKDWNAYAEYMHPAVMNLAGGKQGLISLLQKQSALLDSTEIQTYKVGKIFQLSRVADQYQCIVETLLQMKIRGQVVSSTSYDIAVSKDGNSWAFFRIPPAFTSDQMRKMIPELNSEFKFPRSQTVVGKDLDEFMKTYAIEYLD